MPPNQGALVELDVEKPAAGGRMLARHNGQIVLVWGAIPGERVRARIERLGKGVAYAETVDVMTASPDRRESRGDWRCGGSVLAHVAYSRQLQLKAEIIGDAFGRIGRFPLSALPVVMPSPEHGYRMRARLHVRNGRLGFFREGSHELCDPAMTGQLLPETIAWIATVEQTLRRERLNGLLAIEIAENIPADQRACRLELAEGEKRARYAPVADLAIREVEDLLHVTDGDSGSVLRLQRDVRSFFQGNRFLLVPLVRHVLALVPPGSSVVDLYAGVGLFGLSVAAAGIGWVTAVEGDHVSGADLQRNAEPFGARVTIERRSVELFLGAVRQRGRGVTEATFIVDPPRTGISKEALHGIIGAGPARIIYVSCDVATLARDARALIDAGYGLEGLTGIDLFPNTAHVESVALFSST
jgi:23S rRNA (uracil1939-C5)-methyltransferase